jgi:hypothetical protein
MSIIDSSTSDADQSVFVPKCVYCNSQMTRLLKDTLAKDHHAIFECKDCGWEIAVPTSDIR